MRALPDRPPVPYSATQADVAHIILVCLVVGLLSFLLIAWLIRFEFQWAVLLSRSLVILVALGALALLGAGSVRWSARVLIWGLWCANLEIVSQNGGLHAPQILAFPVQLALAGWLLGRRETALLALLTALSLLALLGLEQAGRLPPPRSRHPFVLGLLVFGNLGIATAAALISRASYLRQCAHLQQTLDQVLKQDAEQAKLLQLLDQCPVGLAITDARHRVEYLNHTLAQSRRVQRGDWLGRDIAALNHQGLTPPQITALAHAQALGRQWHGEQTLEGPQGQHRTESLDVAPLRDAQGRINHWFELSQDTSDRRWAAEQIARLAYTDPATQLPNRAALLDHLETPSPAVEGGQALLLFRLCGLRDLHDAMGPQSSEQWLLAVADALRQHLPASAQGYRLGGGTFAIRLWQLPSGPHEALSHAQREVARWQPWLQRTRPGLPPDPAPSAHTVHQGATLYPWRGDAADTPNAGLQRASLALSQARSEQATQVRWCAPQQVWLAQQRLRGQADWLGAPGLGQLRLLVQGQHTPQGEPVGACLTLLWAHPTLGWLPLDRLPDHPSPPPLPFNAPDQPPPIDWVLAQIAHWQQQHPDAAGLVWTLPWLACWLLPGSDPGDSRAEALLRQLQHHGLRPQQLRLAISARQLAAPLSDNPDAQSPLHTWRHAGFELVLQDLGLGPPSPWDLPRWPFQAVHLSPDLLKAVPGSPPHTALLSGLVSVCQAQGLRVVAQGVDTPAQWQALQGLSPELILQGEQLSPAQLIGDWPGPTSAARPAPSPSTPLRNS